MLVILALVVAALVSQQPETLSLLGEPLYPLPLSKSDRAQADETLRAAHAAYENEPNAVANVLALARAHLAFGRVGDAIEILTHGLEANADDPQLLRDRGRGYILIRKFDIAQRDLRKSAEKVPEANCDLALAQYLAGAFPHAQASYAHCKAPGVFGYLSARRAGATAERRYEEAGDDVDEAGSAPFSAHTADGLVEDVVTGAAQAGADDALGVERREAPRLEALGEREHVLVAERLLQLSQGAESEDEDVRRTVEEGLDLAAVGIGHGSGDPNSLSPCLFGYGRGLRVRCGSITLASEQAAAPPPDLSLDSAGELTFAAA